jgi:tetratricopeptide (TPR) repeat protein
MNLGAPSRLSSSRWLSQAAIAIAAFLPFLATLRFQFVYDDLGQIVSNERIRSWTYLPAYFTEHLWAHMPGIAASYYRPLFLVWLRLNYAFFELHTGYWHLASVMAHVAACLLLYRFVLGISRDSVLSFVAALFFAVHPVHVESVAWVSGSTDVLLAIAAFSMLLFLLPDGSRSRGNRFAALLCFAAALLLKETGVVLLVPLFVINLLHAKELKAPTAAMRTLPFIAVLAAYLALRMFALSGMGAATAPVSFPVWVANTPTILWWYLRNLLWPAQLSSFHDFPLLPFSTPTFLLSALGIGVLALVVWATWNWAAQNLPEKALCTISAALIALPLAPLLKLSSLDPANLVHERYLYLPSAGLAIILAVVVRRLISLLPSPEPGIVLLVGLAVVLGAVTYRESRYWRDEVTLYTRGLQTAPHNVAVMNNLGAALIEGGRCEQAFPILRAAVEQDSKDWLAYANMGECAVEQGNWPNAIGYYNRAVELNPMPALIERLQEARANNARSR